MQHGIGGADLKRAKELLGTAIGFRMASERCFEQRPNGDGIIQVALVPAIVCIAFAAELALKGLLKVRGIEYPRGQPGHSLTVLFRLLPRDLQAIFLADLPIAEFDAKLSESSNAFVEWRYMFDQPPSLSVSPRFLANLAGTAIGRLQQLVEAETA
jgi:hypothetical protein